MTRTIAQGLAVAVVISCASTGTPPPEAAAPQDAVSVGYGTQSRRTTTGAIASITPTEADARVVRIEDLLNRVAGLYVRRLGNGGYTLQIRGQHSLRSTATDDEPLLVIDDLPMPRGSLSSTLSGLALRDIARIDVLKDAAATGIYGARGANGVIIITTKRGP